MRIEVDEQGKQAVVKMIDEVLKSGGVANLSLVQTVLNSLKILPEKENTATETNNIDSPKKIK